MHRSVIERRLFLFYAAKNYHYPKDHDVAKKFKRKARAALDPSTLPSKELGNKSHVDKHRSYFSKVSIQTMPINEVDRYLAEQSIYVGAKEALRRRVLWEWFNKVGTDDKDTVLTVTPRNKGKINNQFGLRDLILANPTICYSDFMVKFGHQMPTVSRTSFNNARCILRKAGYAMPLLPRGPSRPAIVTDSNGHIQRARPLNTTTIEEPEDGKETTDPF
tara:strand:- start:35110 stop:35766 length:657 start_codon:yes stop_codon:yes gene_type:complete